MWTERQDKTGSSGTSDWIQKAPVPPKSLAVTDDRHVQPRWTTGNVAKWSLSSSHIRPNRCYAATVSQALLASAMTLPTFPELMASLKLSNTGEPDLDESEPASEVHPSVPTSSSPPLSPSPFQTAGGQHPPSTSDSPSIVISEFDQVHLTHSSCLSEPRGPRSLGRANRFSPYLGAANNTHARRGSLPNGLWETSKAEVPDRATSSSPPINPNTLRDVSVNAARLSCPPKMMNVDIDATSDVPISSFVRRHTPQSSPTASTFPHRKRSGSFSPVLLPMLLPGLASPSSPHHTIEHGSTSASMNTSLPMEPLKPRNRHQGLRVSSYRPKSNPDSRRTVSLQSAG
ncbi:hypothetical protein BU17DRAFT_80050 [Hysterangium stoloniferum]|nr:hypothetical protein BU17DRAFT_80050 [Hysterangium stoloniferum]